MYLSASRRSSEQIDSVIDSSPASSTTTSTTTTSKTTSTTTASDVCTTSDVTTVAMVPSPRGGAASFPVGPGWVVHLPIMAPDLAAAVSLAEEMAAWLACVPQIDAGAVEVSAEDEQARRVRVLCQRRIPGGRRCWLPRKHEGECYDGQRRPKRRTHNEVARRWVNAIDI
jgi:hypothetical protein